MTGYPWSQGDALLAADLNAAIANSAAYGPFLPISGGTMSGAFTGASGGRMTPMLATPDFYTDPNSWALSGGSLTLRGQPYGGLDTGCLLSLVATTLPFTSTRAGIFAPTGPSGIASYGWLDQAGIYNQVGSCPPPLVLHGVTYDATHVYPATPLTAAQMALLRPNMWVVTNSFNSAITIPPGNALPPERNYTSYITTWATDGTSITVGGWAVPGSGSGAAGQVPSTNYDPGTSGTICYFGSPTNVFCGNFVMHHDPVTYPDARSNSYQGIEFDIVNYDTAPYTMGFRGISMSYNATHGQQAYTDSYGIKLLNINQSLVIQSNAPGFGYPKIVTDAFNVQGNVSPAVWAGSPTYNVITETSSYIDTNQLWFKQWVQRDINGTSYTAASYRMGVLVDPTAPFSLAAGGTMAQLIWNMQGYPFGFTIANGAGTPAVSVDLNGAVAIGKGSALATTTNLGHLTIPFCAGAPTGAPTHSAAGIAIIYDTTNHKFWAYDNGTSTWKGVVLT